MPITSTVVAGHMHSSIQCRLKVPNSWPQRESRTGKDLPLRPCARFPGADHTAGKTRVELRPLDRLSSRGGNFRLNKTRLLELLSS